MSGHIQVALRLRPPAQDEKHDGEENRGVRVTKHHGDGSADVLCQGHEFRVDRLFLENTNQEEFYKNFGQPLLREALQHRGSLCVFACGETGSGKSHTVLGEPEQAGILPRMCADIFAAQAKDGAGAAQGLVKIQAVEEYSGSVYDLLARGQRTAVKLRGDQKRGFEADAQSVPCNTFKDAWREIKKAAARRSVGAHVQNGHSSRGHVLWSLACQKCTVNIVDLAGIERAKTTETRGDMLREAGRISCGLHALANCLAEAAEHERGTTAHSVHVRSSKLTMLLKKPLAAGRVVMLATAAPSSRSSSATLRTLLLAKSAKGCRVERNLPEAVPVERARTAVNAAAVLRKQLAVCGSMHYASDREDQAAARAKRDAVLTEERDRERRELEKRERLRTERYRAELAGARAELREKAAAERERARRAQAEREEHSREVAELRGRLERSEAQRLAESQTAAWQKAAAEEEVERLNCAHKAAAADADRAASPPVLAAAAQDAWSPLPPPQLPATPKVTPKKKVRDRRPTFSPNAAEAEEPSRILDPNQPRCGNCESSLQKVRTNFMEWTCGDCDKEHSLGSFYTCLDASVWHIGGLYKRSVAAGCRRVLCPDCFASRLPGLGNFCSPTQGTPPGRTPASARATSATPAPKRRRRQSADSTA